MRHACPPNTQGEKKYAISWMARLSLMRAHPAGQSLAACFDACFPQGKALTHVLSRKTAHLRQAGDGQS
jgi:hypothetical protein